MGKVLHAEDKFGAHNAHANPGVHGLEAIVGFDGLTERIKDFPTSGQFKMLIRSLNARVQNFYNENVPDGQTDLHLDEANARKLSKELFDVLANHIAVNYLGLKAERIKELKEQKDPASGKPQWISFIREHAGIDDEGIYEALKTRGTIGPREISELARPIYERHAEAFTTKAATSYVDSMERSTQALEYLRKLKAAQPKTLEALSVPTTVKSTDEATRLYVSAIQLLSRDYKPSIAQAYKPAA